MAEGEERKNGAGFGTPTFWSKTKVKHNVKKRKAKNTKSKVQIPTTPPGADVPKGKLK